MGGRVGGGASLCQGRGQGWGTHLHTRGRGLLLLCSHFKGRGLTQNHWVATGRPLHLVPLVGSLNRLFANYSPKN